MPRLRQILPVRATSSRPNLESAFWKAMTLPGSPPQETVRQVSETSTTEARKMEASWRTSVRAGPDGARTLTRRSSRSTREELVTSST